MAAAIEARLPVLRDALSPWDAGCGHLNFAERAFACDRLFTADAYRRLREVKRRHDPQDVLRANHALTIGD